MRRAGYHSNRQLARDLDTDGSLVGKWLSGKVKRITNAQHRAQLPKLLDTPPDYFEDPPPADRLAAVEEILGRLAQIQQNLVDIQAQQTTAIERLTQQLELQQQRQAG